MSFSKEERRLIHKKAQQPLMGNGVPSNLDGKENDVAYRRIPNKGIVHYVKRDGEWQALSSTDSLPAERSVTKTTTTTSGGTSSSVTDHGSMSGLTHDDHTQYLLINGTRAMTGGLSISGDAALNFTAAGENSIRIPDNQASALIIEEAGNAYLTFNTANSSGEKITLGKKLEAGSVEIEGSAFDIDGGDISAATISGGLTWSSAQNLNSQHLTNVNIDSGTIDAVTLGTNSAITEAQIDSVNINGSTINVTSGDLTITAAGGDVSFGDENLATTGTLGSGAITTTGRFLLDIGAKSYTPSNDGILSHHDGGVTLTDSGTSSSGTASVAILHRFENDTLAATNASVTTTDATTMYISSAPSAGTNMTLTNSYALWVDSGITRLDGNLFISTDNSLIYTSNAQTLSVSAGEVKIITNQGGTDDPGDNRIRFVDNTTVFGDIEYDNGDTFKLVTASSTALQLTANGTAELAGTTVNLDSSGDIVLDAAGDDIYFKDGGTERFRMDLDSTPTLAVTGAFDIDCSADITLDAAGNDIKFQSAATHELKFTNSSGSWLVAPQTTNANLTLSPNGTGDVICKLSNDAATSTFVVENSSATDRFVVDGLGTTKVISSSTTANAVDIAATALTTGKALYINHDDSHTEDLTVVSFHLDFDKSGVMDDGETGTYTGFDIDMNDAATNHAGSNVNMTGIDMDVVSANAQGTLTNLGASFTVTGADTNNGIEITTTDGGTDLKIMSSADSGDYFSIATTTHGATTFTTVDDDAAAANLSLVVDGDVAISADGGNVTFSDASLTIFDFDVDNTALTIHDDQDTGDKVVMTVTQHGAFSIVTTDDDAAAANIQITADGTSELAGTTVTLDSSGDVVLDAAGGNFKFKDDGTAQLTLDVDGTAGDIIFNLEVNGDDLVFTQFDNTEVLRLKDEATVVIRSSYITDHAINSKPATNGRHFATGDADYQQNYSWIGLYDQIAASTEHDADYGNWGE